MLACGVKKTKKSSATKYLAALADRRFRTDDFAFRLLTQTEFFDQGAVFVNVFFRVVRKQALALTYHGDQGAARRVVFLVGTQVSRQAFDTVREQGDLCFGVTCVFFVAGILLYDLGDFLFVVVDCHFSL